MKYFLTKQEIRDDYSSDLYEFQTGIWDEEAMVFRKEDSIYLSDSIMYRLEFDLLLLCSIPEYNPFGETSVSKEQWSQIIDMAEKAGGELLELVREADLWAKNVFAEFGVFTIIGL